MSRTNETLYASWHETCACRCRLDASTCNGKHSQNSDKSKCECKALIDKSRYYVGCMLNPSTIECDKSCDVGKY